MELFGSQLDLQAVITSLTPSAGRILLILIATFILQKIANKAISKALKITAERKNVTNKLEFEQRIDTITSVFHATVGVIIWGIAGFIILSELGINIAPILTGAGIAGLAVGFGAQNLVRDVVAGLFVLLEDQYSKGDVVDIAGKIGVVEDINLRRTVLRDLDGVVHHIPNGEAHVASNYTQEYSSINMNIGVDYDTNLDHAIKVINKVGQELAKDKEYKEKIEEAPNVLRVDKFADSAIEIKIVGTTKPIEQWAVMGEMRKRLKEAFDKEGISIPFPHRTIVEKK